MGSAVKKREAPLKEYRFPVVLVAADEVDGKRRLCSEASMKEASFAVETDGVSSGLGKRRRDDGSAVRMMEAPSG